MPRQILSEQFETAADRDAEMRREVSFLDAFVQGPAPSAAPRRPTAPPSLAAIDSLGPQVASDQGSLDETFATLCRRNGRPIIPPFLAVTRRPAHQLEQLPGKEDGRNTRLRIAVNHVHDLSESSSIARYHCSPIDGRHGAPGCKMPTSVDHALAVAIRFLSSMNLRRNVSWSMIAMLQPHPTLEGSSDDDDRNDQSGHRRNIYKLSRDDGCRCTRRRRQDP